MSSSLPLALAGLVGLHLYLFRRATPAGPFHNRHDKKIERFYPKQAFKDSVAILICFAAILAMTRYSPVELGPVADPTSDYLARPPGISCRPIAGASRGQVGDHSDRRPARRPVRGAVSIAILRLREERNPLRRPLATALLVLIIGGSIGLIFLAKHQDRINPEFAEQLKKQEEEMRAYFQAFRAADRRRGCWGKPMAPPKAYAENCAACHGDNGEARFPALIGISAKPQRSKEDLLKILDNRAYGMKAPMPENFPTMTQQEKEQVVKWMIQLK